MSTITINGSATGSVLTDILMADDIVPGTAPSYQLCKTIYTYHPIGGKMVDSPIRTAQSIPRDITVPGPAEEEVVRAFNDEWKALNADKVIAQTARVARIYGVASVACLETKDNEAVDTGKPLDFNKIAGEDIVFSVFDPLNTAGSLVISQIPTQADFIKVKNIRVQGEQIHPSRSSTIMNGDPIYLEYTTSAFGYVGRSVYQPCLFPLKSFIQTMIADDLIATKVGVVVAKIKQPGSIADQLMAGAMGLKRQVVKEAKNYNVINVTPDESIESIDLKNMDGPFTLARKDILENIAAGDDMPSVMLNSETFAQGFADGTEDAKRVANYIDEKRKWMQPLYDYMTKIVQHRAWNKEFIQSLQQKYTDLQSSQPNELFFQWQHAFQATWPSLLKEPESELLRGEELILRSVISVFEILYPAVQHDPEAAADLIVWVTDQFNQRKKLFASPLNFDLDTLIATLEEKAAQAPNPDDLQEPNPPRPRADSTTRALRTLTARMDDNQSGIDRILAALANRPRNKLAVIGR